MFFLNNLNIDNSLIVLKILLIFLFDADYACYLESGMLNSLDLSVFCCEPYFYFIDYFFDIAIYYNTLFSAGFFSYICLLSLQLSCLISCCLLPLYNFLVFKPLLAILLSFQYVYSLFWIHIFLESSTAAFYMSIKFIILIFLLVFVRGGIPRYRFDYLTKLGWVKFLSLILLSLIFEMYLLWIF